MTAKILKIAQREYIEMLRTKAFILSVLMTPVIIGLIIYFTSRITEEPEAPRPAAKVAVLDLSGELSDEIKAGFDRHNASEGNRQMILEQLGADSDPNITANLQKAKLRKGELNMYVVIDKGICRGEGAVKFYSYEIKASDMDISMAVESLVKNAVVDRRFELEELDRGLVGRLGYVASEHVKVGQAPGAERVQAEMEKFIEMMVPFFFMYLMFMGIFGTGQQMLSSVIEEKNSRIIEVLLSAVSPFELMFGKILGLGGIGVTLTAFWAVAAYGAAQWQGLAVNVGAGLIICFAIYYVLGFLFFSSILAGVGSVCNTIKEAQSLMMPITLLFVLPMVAWFKLVRDPDGMFAQVLSFVPPLTPMVMILRISASDGIGLIEILASMAVLSVFLLLVIWLAARIFRTAILMYGKRLSVREIIHCIKQ
ncbi:MAG: ABC transporter permease [Planctomycetota bacterium]